MAQSVVFNLRVSASVIEALGLLLTTWRIYFRLRIHRFWWEDAWAAVLLLTGIALITTYWIYLNANGLTFIVAWWIYTICFNCIITLARMSIIFSIIRVMHEGRHFRRFTYTCVAFFALCWVILIVEKVWQCASDPSWRHSTPSSLHHYCAVGRRISIFEFTTDCIAVSILVILPLHMLWRVKLPRRQRRMILSIFASSVVLAFGALFHTVGQLLDSFILSIAGLHVEVTLSIIVCNLLVVVTYAYRFIFHDSGSIETTEDTSASYDDDFTTPARPSVPVTTLALTTIDLEVSLNSVGQLSGTESEYI